eukprot:TRINITY_DN64764_c0_g1_i1.p1 TRINITY_DN64764_c0_g1~~TRINITY_DN64764_c0_g1_i1.p1  ORF type:complete len:142 (+),score=30.67 TRINITY_DN64764_c0_g1_i1:141-566(+)
MIDTPEFQRLRSIKQLGGTSFVYQTASHSRFEHSLGVAWMATDWAQMLQQVQPELGITEQHILCLQLAGLCHDLGHGPFSHMFDEHFIKPLLESGELQYSKGESGKWEHEEASADMIDHIIETHSLHEDCLLYTSPSPRDS